MGGWRIWCCVDVEKDVVPERVRSEVLAAFARMSPHCLNPTERLRDAMGRLLPACLV
jgi:hypothetical protein